jgi:beta-lactamase class D
MRFAFPNSTVWFYQDTARKTGKRRMQKYLNRAHYGNARIGTTIDQFWLNGTLQISAIEQVEFLNAGRCPSVPARGGVPQAGWRVGTVESERGLHVFALNVDLFKADQAKAREDIGKAILRAEGILQVNGK